MKLIKILSQILFIYGVFFVGTWLKSMLHLPLPGSIIGLLLLWGALLFKVIRLDWVESGSLLFLSYLPLFFIPAVVGVMDYGHIFTGKGILLIPITIISTFFTMWIAGLTGQIVTQWVDKRKEQPS